MKIGISTFDLKNFDFQVQLSSLLENNVAPDVIILHYAGTFNKLLKYIRFVSKIIKQYRFKTIPAILNRSKAAEKTTTISLSLTEKQKKDVSDFLNKVLIVKVAGINDTSTIARINALGNVAIVCNSGLLKQEVLNLPGSIFINIHASRLPKYRGMNNVEWALFENNPIYVTVHRISKNIDEGDILYQEEIDVKNKGLKLIEDYRKYCFFKSNQVIGKAIHKYIKGEIVFVKQQLKYQPLLQYYTMHPVLKAKLQHKLAASAGI